MIRVVVVDDHSLVREGLRSVFAKTDDIRLVEDYGDGADLLAARTTRKRVDVIILDISMTRTDGLTSLERLQEQDDAPPVLILSLHPESTYAEAAIRRGARGYLSKNAPNEVVCDAVRVIARGGMFLTESGADHVLNPPDPQDEQRRIEGLLADLSSRERNVFDGICAGSTQKEIAWELGVSEQTVSTYKRRLMTKLQVSSMVDIVRMGFTLEEREQGDSTGSGDRTSQLRRRL